MRRMITSKTYTIETRLNQRDNAGLIEYVKEYHLLYGKMLRFTWHRYNNGGRFSVKKSAFNTILQNRFHVNKRLANSVISEVEGLYKALYQLKWYEFNQLGGKIKKLYKKRKTLCEKVAVLKEKSRNNQLSPSALTYYHQQKEKIFYTNQKLNKLKQKQSNLLKEIQSKDLHLCFGSKKLFRAQYHLAENKLTSHAIWLDRFRKQRDNRSLYIGSKDEHRCNQIVQLTPMVHAGKENRFVIQLRKNTKKREYVYGTCIFAYLSGLLAKTIVKQDHGISYRIVFRGNACYLQAMVTLDRDTDDCKTRKTYGTIGLDYNDGFIEVAKPMTREISSD